MKIQTRQRDTHQSDQVVAPGATSPNRPDVGAARVSQTLPALRAILLTIFVFGVVGAGIELILLEHTEDTLQWIPLILMTVGLLVAAWCASRPGRVSLRTMQGLMGLYVVSGFVGLVLHYRGNVEFELEMYPSMGGMQLFWESIRGATPTLSPGTMIVLGLIGWAYTFRHPATVRRDRAADVNTGVA